MVLDYRKCAEEIVSRLEGKENVISAAHCATRLRLVIADKGKIDKKALENADIPTWRLPIATAANFAQFGACLAVALKCRDQKTKSVALPSSLSTSLGITEPAINNIPYVYC